MAEHVDSSASGASRAGNTAKNGTLGSVGQPNDARRDTRGTGAATSGQNPYRAANVNCESVPPHDKAQCQRDSEGKSASVDKNSAALVALLILFRGYPGDRVWPNNRE